MAKFLKANRLRSSMGGQYPTSILINLDKVQYFEQRTDDEHLTDIYMDDKSPIAIDISIDKLAEGKIEIVDLYEDEQ